MVFLFFILFFFLVKPVFAAPVVQITVAPASLSSTAITFPVTFIIQNAPANSSYYYKFYGGIGESTTQIQTSSSLTYTSDWTSFNTVTVDAGGSAVVNSSAYIKSDVPSGSYNLYTRIALIPKATTWTTYDSSASIISVTAPSPTATPTPTNTPTPTATPTSDPTVTNPSSGISMTEFMPYSDPEWVEIRNTNNNPVKLVGWKLEDKDGHTRNISDITIGANSYYIFEYSAFFDNNNNETVIFRRQDNTVINQTSYSGGLRTVDRSWSFINNNWCQSSITKGYENVSSCYSAPTATVTPSNTLTPTPDQSKFTSADTATESAIIEPSEGSSFITPNTTTPVSTNGEVLGQDITNATKKNYLPLILIIFGGLLLTSPVIISKLKK